VRFEVSKVLDAIEARLTTDPALARAVVDLSEVARYADLDGGRPASMLRLGLVIDALSRHVAEEMDHHPDIDIRWRTLTFVCATHSAGGVTMKDIDLARRIDEIVASSA